MIPAVKRISRTLFPKDSPMDKKIKGFGVRLRLINAVVDHRYHAWVVEKESKLFKPILSPKKQVKISIVTPFFNTPDKYIQPLLYSVINQTYDNWEWIIVNASNDNERKKVINDLEQVDTRIKVINVPNKGISENTNAGLEQASGEYIAFTDHDDTLANEALNEVGHVIHDTSADLIYSDEDKLTEDGRFRRKPHIKPKFSPDLLQNLNYITHLVVAKKELVNKVGKLHSEFDGAQDYDFLLRAVDKAERIEHIPRFLYHWREAAGSTAADFEVKQGVLDAGVKALQNHLNRNDIAGEAEAIEGKPGYYRIKYPKSRTPVEAIVSEKLPRLLAGAIYEVYPQFEKSKDVNVLIVGKEVGFPEALIAELNDYLSKHDQVGAVSPVVINSSHQVVDAGQINTVDKKMFYGVGFPENTYFGDTDWVRNVDQLGRYMYVTKSSVVQEFLKSHSHNDLFTDTFSDFISKHGMRKTVLAHTRLVIEKDIHKEDEKLINDMSVFEEYTS